MPSPHPPGFTEFIRAHGFSSAEVGVGPLLRDLGVHLACAQLAVVRGGDPVLPAAYFGRPEAAYSPANHGSQVPRTCQLAPCHSPAMEASFALRGGGSSPVFVRHILREAQTQVPGASGDRVAKAASHVQANLSKRLRAAARLAASSKPRLTTLLLLRASRAL